MIISLDRLEIVVSLFFIFVKIYRSGFDLFSFILILIHLEITFFISNRNLIGINYLIIVRN